MAVGSGLCRCGTRHRDKTEALAVASGGAAGENSTASYTLVVCGIDLLPLANMWNHVDGVRSGH